MTSEVLTEKKTDEEEGKRENGLSVVMLLLFDMSTKKIFFPSSLENLQSNSFILLFKKSSKMKSIKPMRMLKKKLIYE